MKNTLTVEIQNIRGIGHLKINMPLTPDVYAITGINGIGKSTLPKYFCAIVAKDAR